MKEYVGVKGSGVYLINMDYNEACLFDSYGGFVSQTSGVLAYSESLGGISECNILSILGSPNSYSEVYLDGRVLTVKMRSMDVYMKLRDVPRVNHLVFRRVLGGGVVQTLIAVKKDSISQSKIAGILGVSDAGESL